MYKDQLKEQAFQAGVHHKILRKNNVNIKL